MPDPPRQRGELVFVQVRPDFQIIHITVTNDGIIVAKKTDKGLFRAVKTMVLNTGVPFWKIFATNLQNLC